MLANVANDSQVISSVDHTYAEEHDQRLLIVDDEEPVCKLFANCLSERYSCETAANAQEALEWLQKRRFSKGISDIQMPRLGGIVHLRKIIEHSLYTTVINSSRLQCTHEVIQVDET